MKPRKKTPRTRGGLIQSYTGEGRGKSSAAAGLALRARGEGMKVLLVRFFKKKSSEDTGLEKLGVKVFTSGSLYNFTKPSDKCKIQTDLENTFENLAEEIRELDLLILDEILIAVQKNFMEEERLLEFLSGKPGSLEVILTGRGITRKITAISDLVSEIREVKHPFSSGVKARYGFDR